MKWTRRGLAALLSVATLLLAAEPVAAQASVTSQLINELNAKLLYVAIPITLLVEIILVYTVLRFKDNDDPSPTEENRRLEITWTIATAVILLFVGVASYGVLANENVTFQAEEQQIAPDDNDVLVHMNAFQWGWEAAYPNENVTLGGPTPTIYIPADQDVYFTITSDAVLHGFAVPELGLKQDAFPGRAHTIKTVPLEEGTYQGYCTEFCGVGHSNMYFTVEVVSQEEYQNWLDEQRADSSGSDTDGGSGNASDVEAAAVSAPN